MPDNEKANAWPKTRIEKFWEEFYKKYKKPVVEDIIVGGTGIHPDELATGGMSTEELTELIKDIVSTTPGIGGGEGCDCREIATDQEYDEMLKVVGLL